MIESVGRYVGAACIVLYTWCSIHLSHCSTFSLTTPPSFLIPKQQQYNIIRRVRELDLLQTTVDSGLLSSLEAQGVDLVTIEKLLPIAEELGLLSVAANNQQLIVNLAAFFLVEGAPFLLPPIAGAVKVGPTAMWNFHLLDFRLVSTCDFS